MTSTRELGTLVFYDRRSSQAKLILDSSPDKVIDVYPGKIRAHPEFQINPDRLPLTKVPPTHHSSPLIPSGGESERERERGESGESGESGTRSAPPALRSLTWRGLSYLLSLSLSFGWLRRPRRICWTP